MQARNVISRHPNEKVNTEEDNETESVKNFYSGETEDYYQNDDSDQVRMDNFYGGDRSEYYAN